MEKIVIERGKTISLNELPEYSIALDGFVSGPGLDPENHRYSFDHHGKCSRFSTDATCEQAHHAIELGLDPSSYTIFCNDVDIDVCAAIWCLKYPERCKEPLVKKIIDAIGKADRYAGAYTINGMERVVEWVSAPETDSKRNGDYEKLSNDGLMPIMESILHRITRYADGDASIEISKHEQQSNFKIIRNENGWAMLESQDPHALGSIWQSGFDRIALVRPLEDKSTAITIAKRSDFIEQFPLNKIFKLLNAEEPGWGGGSTIGGAPRNGDGSRSKLKLEKIINIIDSVVAPETVKKPTTMKPPAKKKKTVTKAAAKKKKS